MKKSDNLKILKDIKKLLLEKEKPTIQTTPSTPNSYDFFDMDSCLCTDGKRSFKELYLSEREAEKVAKFLFDEQGITLMVYPCPYSSGWHLSRR